MKSKLIIKLKLLIICFFTCAVSSASDHGEGHIGDTYIFKRGDKLILVMTVLSEHSHDNNLHDAHFSNEILYRFYIDRNADVSYNNLEMVKRYGGKITNPDKIKEDIIIEISFDNDGHSKIVTTSGLYNNSKDTMEIFSGLRDEPFIRAGLEGKNILSLVVELPISSILTKDDSTSILAWASTSLKNKNNQLHDHGGHPYRSQINKKLNGLHPSKHLQKTGLQPDVLIYNLSEPTLFPNGRELIDDVVDILPDNIVTGKPPYPTSNDVPFLEHFPYLAEPHGVVGRIPGPLLPVDIHFAPLAIFDLESEIGMPERKVRIRYWIMNPGGIIMNHKHEKRPAIVYLLNGEVIETKKNPPNGNITTKTIQAHQAVMEPTDIEHWWINNSGEMVKMVAVDIPEPKDSNTLNETKFDIIPRPLSNPLQAPKNPSSIKIDELGAHDLEKLFPEIGELRGYKMRARRYNLQPNQETKLFNSSKRPTITYIISGDVLEYRSDQLASTNGQEALIKRQGDFSLAIDGVSYYWHNPTSEIAELFIVDFIKN